VDYVALGTFKLVGHGAGLTVEIVAPVSVHHRWTAVQESSIRAVCQRYLAWDDQLGSAGVLIESFAIGDILHVQVFSRSGERPVLRHHSGHPVCPLSGGTLLLASSLPVLESAKPLSHFFSSAFVQIGSYQFASGYFTR
jgi:hypothetical protein